MLNNLMYNMMNSASIVLRRTIRLALRDFATTIIALLLALSSLALASGAAVLAMQEALGLPGALLTLAFIHLVLACLLGWSILAARR